MLKRIFKWRSIYTIPATFLSVRVSLLILLLDLLLGIVAYKLIEGYSILDAVYMTIITLSTVGYTEVEPLSDSGQLFTSLFILLNIGIFAYIVSVFSYYIIQGEIFKNLHLNFVKSSIDSLQDHVIICGYGKYGREIAQHLEDQEVPFVVIDQNTELIESIRREEGKILYIGDDATQDEVLIRAGVKRANALISALPDDSDNVFTVLTARQLNPKVNIISRAKLPRSQKKLLLAGADHVVMPEQIGGFYMATLVSRPGAVEFFYFITNEYMSDIGFEEVRYEELPEDCKDLSIRELHLRRDTGATIIGFKHSDGRYDVNPSPDTVLGPNTSFIVLGSREQIEAVREFFGRKG